MSAGTLSAQQVRSLVEDKWQRDIDALAVGLHVAATMVGPESVEFEFGTARVIRADTVFEVREALLTAEREQQRLVLLTDLQQHDLGHDVVGRLARSRLFAVDHWAGLCSLFRARELDRAILDPVLAQALMEHAPPDGYPPVSAGVLDSGTVWRAICRHVFAMGDGEPDLAALLLWASSDNGASRFRAAGSEICERLQSRLTSRFGDAAAAVLSFAESGNGIDPLAFAVACQVIFGRSEDEVLTAVAARMERYHDNIPLTPEGGRRLGLAAAQAIAELDRLSDPRISQEYLEQADRLLTQLKCTDHAWRSTLTRAGFGQRLERLGKAITVAVRTSAAVNVAECELRLQELAQHRLAAPGRCQDQLTTAEMAVRLVRWIQLERVPDDSFAEHCRRHIRECSFVDWAREPLCRGADEPILSDAYRQLDGAVLRIREEVSRSFAGALADWTAVGSSEAGVIGVEDVLDRVVSRVVQAGNHVLVVVLDGMSWAVCHELLEDIRQDHWFESTLDEDGVPPQPVLATIPSVTNCSRASLLSGKLTHGGQNVEQRNFGEHAALLAECDRRSPPVLFHKADLTEGNRGMLTVELSQRITTATSKVVGVVINAIDDRLANAQQIVDNWSLSRISPLRALLRLARDSGRVVILASDHGHVWHRPDASCRSHEESSRWRADNGEPLEDEVRIRGARVITEDHSVIVPWSENVYYRTQQNGYHGGGTPQEMVCPLVLLTDRTSAYSGLHRCEYPKPDWWSAAPQATPGFEEPRVRITVPQPSGAPTLFDLEEDAEASGSVPVADETKTESRTGTHSAAGWVNVLLSSESYRSRRAMIRRHPVEDGLMSECLTALDASGGIMTPAAFAAAVNISVARLDGLVVQMQRVLNVDGYEILDMDRAENRVELNIAKLRRQFGLD